MRGDVSPVQSSWCQGYCCHPPPPQRSCTKSGQEIGHTGMCTASERMYLWMIVARSGHSTKKDMNSFRMLSSLDSNCHPPAKILHRKSTDKTKGMQYELHHSCAECKNNTVAARSVSCRQTEHLCAEGRQQHTHRQDQRKLTAQIQPRPTSGKC